MLQTSELSDPFNSKASSQPQFYIAQSTSALEAKLSVCWVARKKEAKIETLSFQLSKIFKLNSCLLLLEPMFVGIKKSNFIHAKWSQFFLLFCFTGVLTVCLQRICATGDFGFATTTQSCQANELEQQPPEQQQQHLVVLFESGSAERRPPEGCRVHEWGCL